jgi:tetratricopeptide (TPR) repeat protein
VAKRRPANTRPAAKTTVRSPRVLAPQPIPAPRPAALAAEPLVRPPQRAGYAQAVALYEQGVAALQGHEYSRASTLLRSVLSGYPDEKELHERARLYLNICERQVESRASAPKSPEERIFAATVAFNTGDYDEALIHLRAAAQDAPDHDHALYMMAATLALRDQPDEAVAVLLRAIELNSENRAMARHDPDLASIRGHEHVRAALEAVAPPRTAAPKVARRTR